MTVQIYVLCIKKQKQLWPTLLKNIGFYFCKVRISIFSPNQLTLADNGWNVNLNYSKKNDEELIRLAANDDTEALGALYDRYKALVFSLAINIVGNHEAAEDITLDVFTKIWEKADIYQSEKATVKRWISSITRYRSIDVLRRRNAHLDMHSPRWSDLSPDTLPAKENPEGEMELALVGRKVTEAISKLPAEQKKPLALAYFMGYSHQQIAEALNKPLGTIKTRIRLAIQKLQKELKDDEETNDRSKLN